jgi:hypothetical protein
MSNTSVKVAVLFVLLALPAASFGRGGGSAGMGPSGGVEGARSNAARISAFDTSGDLAAAGENGVTILQHSFGIRSEKQDRIWLMI